MSTPPADLSSNPYGYEYAPGNDFSKDPNENADRIQRERRASIQAIMADQSLTPLERRRSIQGLMDGRRKSTGSLPTNTSQSTSKSETSPFEMEKNRPACTHYERNCTIIAPCCGMAFGCRICHDEFPDLPKVDQTSSGGEDEDEESHKIDRFKICEIICRSCYTRQSSKTNRCFRCKIEFSDYHCAVCNLWMSAEEKPYHCSDCGFCRLGGAENYEHCQDCGICIDKQLIPVHECKQGKYLSNCPVCQEDLFSSRAASHELPCGHAIHWHCYQKLASFDSRCPVCKKTTEDPQDMAETWREMALTLELQPVPPELAKVVDISCNDCELPSINCRWHILGVQCKNCNSFNTVVDQVRLTGEQALAFLDDMAQNEGEQNNMDDDERFNDQEESDDEIMVNGQEVARITLQQSIESEYSVTMARGMDVSDRDTPSPDVNMQEQNAPNTTVDDDNSSIDEDEIYIPPQWNNFEDRRDSNTQTDENCNGNESDASSNDGEMESDEIYIPRRWRFDIPVGGTERSIID